MWTIVYFLPFAPVVDAGKRKRQNRNNVYFHTVFILPYSNFLTSQDKFVRWSFKRWISKMVLPFVVFTLIIYCLREFILQILQRTMVSP
jgi:hypothetical protein